MSYRSAPQEEPARRVAFHALSTDTQLRLAVACSGRGVAPLLVDRPALLGSPARWAALLLVALALPAALLLASFGDIRQGSCCYSDAERAALVLGGTASLLAVLLGARSARIRRGLPFPPGVYLFARELVDARRSRLVLIPTTQLRGARRVRRRVELSFDGGDRFSFPLANLQSPDDIEREIKTTLDTLLRAESTGDVATQINLDPFDDERPHWSERPLPPASRMPRFWWLDSPWPLVALGLGVGPVLSLLGSGALARESDAWGIRQAQRFCDEASLFAFLTSGRATPTSRRLADDTLFALTRSHDTSSLLHYLEFAHDLHTAAPPSQPFAHWQEASDELHRRLVQHRTPALVRAFIAHGVGPLRDQEDQALFDDAMSRRDPLNHRDCYPLERYALVGSHASEVLDVHLPRCLLDQAIEKRNIERIRAIAHGEGRDDLRTSALQALHREYDQARERLAASTGLRTSLAQAVDAALLHARDNGGPLLIVPMGGSDFAPTSLPLNTIIPRKYRDFTPIPTLLESLHKVLGMYVDDALLPIYYYDPDTSPMEPPTLRLLYSPSTTADCSSQKRCAATIEIRFLPARPRTLPRDAYAQMPQILRIKGLFPGLGAAGDSLQHSFREVAAEAFQHALLGDTK